MVLQALFRKKSLLRVSEENKITKPDTELVASVPPNNSQEWWNRFLEIFLKDPTKFTILGLFFLYFLGFLIWHFYLSSFGVTSIPFLQTEYISAAFCFLIMFVCLSLPAFLVVKVIRQNISSTGIRGFHQWDTSWVFFLIIWYYITDNLFDIFLPGSKISPFGDSLQKGISILMILHFLFGIFLFVKGGFMEQLKYGTDAKITDAQKQFRNSRLVKISNPIHFWPVYLAALLFVKIFCTHEISKLFFFLTIIYWFAYTTVAVPGLDLKQMWKHGFVVRFVVVLAIFLYTVIYIENFSLHQFDKISKSVGGGKPEKACFVVSQSNSLPLQHIYVC